jgi:monofunctional glycosyltransferase
MKPVLRKSLIILFIAGILIPVLLYFYILGAHDVERLQRLYPVVKEVTKGQVEVSMSETKPLYWIPLKKISRAGQWAIVLSEDWAFYQHNGVDVEQMKVAMNEMLSEQRFRGASTISQQMVKNVFLSDDRTLWRKLNEYILTREVENILSKEKILEIYFNCIEYGPSVYGIKAASYHYFNKAPSGLTPREGAFLAMLLPSPKRYYRSFKRKRLTTFAKSRIQAILEKMRMAKIITKEVYERELSERFSWETL